METYILTTNSINSPFKTAVNCNRGKMTADFICKYKVMLIVICRTVFKAVFSLFRTYVRQTIKDSRGRANNPCVTILECIKVIFISTALLPFSLKLLFNSDSSFLEVYTIPC